MNDSLLAEVVVVAVLLAAVFLRIGARIGALEARLHSLSRLDAKLDALLKHAGIQFDPYADVPPGVSDALRRGKKIEAIKAYREATGSDLKDAKEYVEELQRRR